jgi:hypothetical protein
VCLLAVQFGREELDFNVEQQGIFPGIFCICGLLFSLLCPSVQFIPIIPVLAFYGFRHTDAIFSFFLVLFGAFTLTKYTYQIYYLATDQTGSDLA